MLIRIFKKNYIIQFVVFLMLGFALWISAFISPPAMVQESEVMPLYNFILLFLSNQLILIILSFFLLMFQAIYLNQVLIRHSLIPRNTFIGALVYIVLMSYSNQLLHFYPFIIASFFVIAIMDIMLKIDENEEGSNFIFKAGFLTGLASLFYFPSIILLIFIWSGLLAHRIPHWRHWILPIVGIFTPYLFLFTIYFWYDTSIENLNYYLSYFSEIKLFISTPDNIVKIISALLIFLIILSILRVMRRLSGKRIMIRKKITIIFFLFLSSILVLFLDNDLALNTCIIYIPSAIFISIYFSALKKLFLTDLIFTLLVILIIYNNYSH